MLTIKLSIAGSILISQSPEVAIGHKGSELYQSVIGMTAAEGEALPLDAVQKFPETFDGDGAQLSEEMTLNIPRKDVQGEPFAVLITDVAASCESGVIGTNYQFLYAGDMAEVLNENGCAIQVVV